VVHNSRSSVLGIVTSLRAEWFGVRIPEGPRDFYFMKVYRLNITGSTLDTENCN
jgi:hypothetical protein